MPLFVDRDSFEIKRVFFLGKCVRTAAKTMVVDRKDLKALALLYLKSGPLPNDANSWFPYAVPMSALRIDWFRFFFCYSYGSQLFGLKVFLLRNRTQQR